MPMNRLSLPENRLRFEPKQMLFTEAERCFPAKKSHMKELSIGTIARRSFDRS